MKAITHQEEDRTKAGIYSLLFHAALLTLLFMYRFAAPEPITEAPAIMLEWGGGGDNAAAGKPDEGQGNRPTNTGQQLEDPTSTAPAEIPTPVPAKVTPVTPAKTAPPAAKPPLTSTDPNVAALRKQQEDAKKKQQADAEAERQRKASEAAAIAAAEAEKKHQQDEFNKKKGAFGGAFGNGGGSGSGNTGKPGNQGIPGGTGDNPFGKSNGSGGGTGGGIGTGTGPSIGGGLTGRAVRFAPRMVDNSQKTGKVMLEVCVDGSGNVLSADYTLKGSTTNDSELRAKAIQWAKQYKFAASNNEKDCGTFAFNFQVQ